MFCGSRWTMFCALSNSDPGYMSRKFESFERINSIRETNGNFDSFNSCKRLGTSRFRNGWFPAVQNFRIFLLMYPGSLSIPRGGGDANKRSVWPMSAVAGTTNHRRRNTNSSETGDSHARRDLSPWLLFTNSWAAVKEVAGWLGECQRRRDDGMGAADGRFSLQHPEKREKGFR